MRTSDCPHILILILIGLLHLPLEAKRPNVLLIMIDDLDDSLGGYGNPDAITPNIDRLAQQGVLFENAHCQAPLCGPSRASLMSGLRPSTTGIYGQIKDEDLRQSSPQMRSVQFLPEYFKNAGYKTMGIGKLFHEHVPAGMLNESGGRSGGFGPKPPNGRYFVWNEEGTSTDWGAYPARDAQTIDYQSAQWAIERLNRSYAEPFFLMVGFIRPHVPWYVPPRWFELYNPDLLTRPPYNPKDNDDLPDIALRMNDLPMYPTTEWAIKNKQWGAILQGYLASVSFVDHYAGRVLKALENSEHAQNTIVVLVSDHGYRLGEKNTFAKSCLWQPATHTPMILKGPGIPAGARVKATVELLDIYPTLLDLCDLPAYTPNEGRSLRLLLESPNAGWPYPAITTFGWQNHAIVTEDYRYIRYEDGSEELYDHRNDPDEWQNLAQQSRYAPIIQALRWFLPEDNKPWAVDSYISANEYFIQNRIRNLAQP